MRQFDKLDKDSSGILDAMDVVLAREEHTVRKRQEQIQQPGASSC
jgi:hypothetical protein